MLRAGVITSKYQVLCVSTMISISPTSGVVVLPPDQIRQGLAALQGVLCLSVRRAQSVLIVCTATLPGKALIFFVVAVVSNSQSYMCCHR